MTGVILAAVAVAALAAWILLPLLSRRTAAAPPPDDRLARLIETKHAVYRSILDLELDRSLGKVSDADYVVIRRQHEADALAVLREMDAVAAGSLEDVLEREIAEARERLRSRR